MYYLQSSSIILSTVKSGDPIDPLLALVICTKTVLVASTISSSSTTTVTLASVTPDAKFTVVVSIEIIEVSTTSPNSAFGVRFVRDTFLLFQ